MVDCAKEELIKMKPTSEYLVAIDSDGCVFDAMGIKQRECFCPMMIAYFGLQPVAKAVRECKEFADLFSKTRGANRHKTAVRILTELLPSHPIVKESNFDVPQFPNYIKWVNNPDSLLSNKGLKQAILKADGQAKNEFETVLKWSIRVDEMISEVVKNIPPFPYVCESLEKVRQQADIIICSSTPLEALIREWTEHDILKYIKAVGGQEMGSKAEQLKIMIEKYDTYQVLMIGDALGDQKAAESNGILFYPINPGNEAESWKRFYEDALDIFLKGKYLGKYQNKVKNEFAEYLPDIPHWEK